MYFRGSSPRKMVRFWASESWRKGEHGWRTSCFWSHPVLAHAHFFPLHCAVLVAQLGPTLCDPMDCSPSGSSVHGIFPARILESIVISSSRGSSSPWDWIQVSCVSYSSRQVLHHCTTWEAPVAMILVVFICFSPYWLVYISTPTFSISIQLLFI